MMTTNYYIARLDIRHCFVDIRINDVPLLRRNVTYDFTAEIPINYLIEYTGEQVLTVQIYPELGNFCFFPNCKCCVEIWRYDGSGSKIVPIDKLCTSLQNISESEEFLSSKSDKKVFFSDVSYQIIRWSGCEEIKDSSNIGLSVVTYFQDVGKLLANKRYHHYMDLVEERERNICTALFLDMNEVIVRNKMLFDYLDNGFVLEPMNGSRIQLYANGRIVTILDNDMKSALRFINKETGEILAIDLLLGIKKGKNVLSII